jgi:phenylpyruvate tautomerase PptA (4-oxalocrotonate tautomerase family)
VKKEMPVITIQIIKGSLDQAQKAEMVKRVSEVVAEIECRPNPKENVLPFTYCIVEEIEANNFATNGVGMTLEMLQGVKTGHVYVVMK